MIMSYVLNCNPRNPQNGHSGLGHLPSGSASVANVDYAALAQKLVAQTPPQFQTKLDLTAYARDVVLPEWIGGSGVSPDTALANICLLRGEPLLDLITRGVADTIHKKYPEQNYLAEYKKRYAEPCAHGAWGFFGLQVTFCAGIYRIKQNTTHPIIKFKKPRLNAKKEVIKYENFPFCEAFPLLPYVSETAVYSLAERYNRFAKQKGLTFKGGKSTFNEVPVELIWNGDVVTSSLNYWYFVLWNPFIAVGITEGAKKGCALLDVGIPTVIVRGITIWRKALFPENDWEYEWEVKKECEREALIGRLFGRPLRETITIQENIKEDKKYEWLERALETRERELSLRGADPDWISYELAALEHDLRQQVKKGHELAHAIAAFNHPSRPFLSAFDSEPPYKLNTRVNVSKQLVALAKKIQSDRNAAVQASPSKGGVRILTWDCVKGKGIDDYLSNFPTREQKMKASDELIKKALSVEDVEKKLGRYKAQKLSRDTFLNTTHLSGSKLLPQHGTTLELPHNGKLPSVVHMDDRTQQVVRQGGMLLIQSPIGTGKTEWFCNTLRLFLSGKLTLGGIEPGSNIFVVVLTPSNSLGKQVCERLNQSLSGLSSVVSAVGHNPTPFKHRTQLEETDDITAFFGIVSCAEGLHLIESKVLASRLQLPPSLECLFGDPHHEAVERHHTEHRDKVLGVVRTVYPVLEQPLKALSDLVSVKDVDESTLATWALGRSLDEARVLALQLFGYLASFAESDEPKLYGVLYQLYRKLAFWHNVSLPASGHDDLPPYRNQMLDDCLMDEYGATACYRPLLDFAENQLSSLNVVVFLDEVDTIVKNLILGHTSDYKVWAKTVTVFQNLLFRAKLVVGAQANITTPVISVLREFSCKEPHTLLCEPPQSPRLPSSCGKICFYWGNQGSAKHMGAFLSELIKSIEAGVKVLITTTSKRRAQQMAVFLCQYFQQKRKFINILEVDSDNSAEEKNQALFSSPDYFLHRFQPDVLIVSPCLKTGVSIDSKYFGQVWGLFGSGNPNDIDQMLGRVRQPVERHVWISEYFTSSESVLLPKGKRNHSTLRKQLAKELRDNYDKSFDIECLDDKLKSPKVRYRRFTKKQVEAMDNLLASIKLEENYGNLSPAYILMELFKRRGWQIEHSFLESLQPDCQEPEEFLESLGNAWLDAKSQVIFRTAEDIFYSKPAELDDVSRILRSSKSTYKERCEAKKALILQSLKGAEELAKKSVEHRNAFFDVIYEHVKTNRRFIKGPKLWAKGENFEACMACAAQKAANLALSGNTNPNFAPRDHRQAALLREVGFFEFVRDNPTYSADDKNFQDLILKIKERAADFKSLFKLIVDSEGLSPIQLFGNLLRKLGREQVCVGRPGSSGKRPRIYRIKEPSRAWQFVFECHTDWLKKQSSTRVTAYFTSPEERRGGLDEIPNTGVDPPPSDNSIGPPTGSDTT